MTMRSLPLFILTSLAASGLLPGNIKAAPAAQSIQLRNENASFLLNFEEAAFEDEWIVNGVDSLFSQKIFLSFGGSDQSRLSTLSDFDLLSISPPPSDQISNQAKVSLLGFDNQLRLDIEFSLTGDSENSGKSQLNESYRFTNLSDQAQPVSFFYYQDYDIGGPSSFSDDLTVLMGNQLVQFDLNSPEGRGCLDKLANNQNCDLNDFSVDTANSVIVTSDQIPDQFEVGPYPTLLTKLFSDPPIGLSSQNPAFLGDGTAVLQFDRLLNGQGGSTAFLFNKQLHVPTTPAEKVPEPASGLALLGIGGYLWRFWRRSNRRF